MITIPESDLVVHELCLGSNIFGSNATETESHLVMDAYRGYGGNFIDTADMYNQWVPGHVGGESETVIGKWMKSRNNRSEMIVATKVSKMDARPGLSAKNIFTACEESLNRLQTDYIDLYYSHADDESVALDETLGAYAQLVAYEGEMSQAVADLGLSNIPFYGIARGFLTGKYRPGVSDVDSKRAAGAREYATEKGYAILTAMDEVSAAHNGAPLSAIALAWLRSQPTVSVPIASARTVNQLEEIVQVIELTQEQIESLTKLSN